MSTHTLFSITNGIATVVGHEEEDFQKGGLPFHSV